MISPEGRPELPERVLDVLLRSQARGFIGDGDLEPHLENAAGFSQALRDGGASPSGFMMDLGSGGGLPGLVLASWWPEARWVLLDATEQRTAFLTEAVAELGFADRVEVVRGRAEDLGRLTQLRSRFDAVVSRSFGAPAIVAECAAPFLAVGGLLVVSEPPGTAGERWDHPLSLAALGLERAARVGGFELLRQAEPCPDRYPRRVGIPRKRPLF